MGATLHPSLELATSTAANTIGREGDLPTNKPDGKTYQVTSDGGVTLSIQLDSSHRPSTIVEARHSGAHDTSLRGVLDTFCRVIEGLPLQEAADHGAIHTLERLRDRRVPSAVPGILTPRNAGSSFSCCERLIRGILLQHQKAVRDVDTHNFWTPPLSNAWRSKNDKERIALLQPMLAAFRAAHGLNEQDLWLADIKKTRRVVIGFGPGISYDRKPELIMELELEVREATGDRLEFLMEEKKDINQIRRLGTDEIKS